MSYNYYAENNEYNECSARGACSLAPKVSSLQEVLIIFFRQISYYAQKLDEFDRDISSVTEKIVSGLASIISTTDYTDEQLLNMVSMYYNLLVKTKRDYVSICKENNKRAEELKFGLKITPQMNLSAIIAQGERIFLEKYRKTPSSLKNMTEILLFVLKSICINILELKSLEENDEIAVKSVMSGLDILNSPKLNISAVKNTIKELVDVNRSLIDRISKVQVKRFGKIEKKSVSHSTSSGKAILVSGNNMSNLMSLLKEVENKDIDIYTHDDLLIAHAFESFNKIKQLKGHYGICSENCVLDFATFPGAILLTQNSYRNVEYLYRGRLFTTDDIQPKGVIKLENNDYSKLIESAENAKGFAKGRKLHDETVGYNEEELSRLVDSLAKNFHENKFEKLIIIGHTIKSYKQDEYFEKLLKLSTKKNYVISFSYICQNDNCVFINLANSLPRIYSVLKRLFRDIPLDSARVAFFITKCDVTSISHMISLKKLGAKNIFLSNCQPKINPSITSTLRSIYGIKLITNPEDDIKSF